ncbi:apolipoprotein L2-like [Haliotis asinina]|uniref:apolipoprotein L2-like n=1 Tax=Haliotis asinina TaxID=109174 RepID=UPI0035318046
MGKNDSTTLAVVERLRSVWQKIKRIFCLKWAKVKALFVGKPNVKAQILVTDENDHLDRDNDNKDLVASNMVLTITFESPDELEWIRRQFSTSFKTLRASRDEFLNELIQLHYTYGVQVQQIYTKADKADIAASTLGMISNALGFVGFGLAFATFGTSLIISLTGAALGVVSGCVSFAIHRKRMAAKKDMWKKIKARTDNFNQENEKLLHILSEAEYFGFVTSGVSGIIEGPLHVGLQAFEVAKVDEFLPVVADVGPASTKASESLVKGLTAVDQVLFYGGFICNVVSTVIDVCTIVNNSKRLFKGELCDQAQTHYAIAGVYEQLRDSGESVQECVL